MAEPTLAPTATLILALALAGRWRTVAELAPSYRPWAPPSQPPPPS